MIQLKKRILIPFYLLFLLTILSAGTNLLKNPGMESGGPESVNNWNLWSYYKTEIQIRWESAQPREGKKYVSLAFDEPNDGRLIQSIQVEPGKTYKFSGWIRTVGVNENKLGANLSVKNHFFTSEDVKGTSNGWIYKEIYINTLDSGKKIELSLGLSLGGYGNLTTGKAYFDQISFEEVSEVPAAAKVFSMKKPASSSSNSSRPARSNTKNNTGDLAIQIFICAALALFFFLVYRKQLFGFIKGERPLPPLYKKEKGLKSIIFSPYVTIPFFIVIGLIFLLDLFFSINKEPIMGGGENAYLYQAMAILEGKMNISQYLHDTAIVGKKYYVIYPPFPLLVLLPFAAIWGLATETAFIALLFACVTCFIFYRILLKLKTRKEHIPWLIGAFIFGTAFWFCLKRAYGVPFFAHMMSVFGLTLAINEALGKKRGILVGLFLGMAFLSRQLSIYFVIFFLFALWETEEPRKTSKKMINLGTFLAAFGFSMIIYLWYNWARFGNIFDTGYDYLKLGGYMNQRVAQYGQFNIAYLPFNFFYLFLQGFHFTFGGGMMLTPKDMDWFGTSITFASPFVFFAFKAKWKKKLLMGAWISIALTTIHQMLYYNNGWVQMNGQRFTLDFIPLLMVLVALGIKNVKPKYWKPAILFAIVMNAIAMMITN